MPAIAKLSNYTQSPRKVRLVATLLCGKSVEDALIEVKMLDKRAAAPIEKLLKSAVANAKAQGMAIEGLHIKELRVDKGIVMKRSMPRAMGRAFPINKRTSNVLVVLDEKAAKKSVKKVEAAGDMKAVKPVAKKTTTKKKTTK